MITPVIPSEYTSQHALMWPAVRASFVFPVLPHEQAHSKISILIIYWGLPAVIPSEYTSQHALMWPAARASFVFPVLPHE
jgi:hypothetical protein